MGHLFGADTVDLVQVGLQQTWGDNDDAIFLFCFDFDLRFSFCIHPLSVAAVAPVDVISHHGRASHGSAEYVVVSRSH